MIEVDIHECLEEGITPSQYCYLKLLWGGDIDLARDLYYNDPGIKHHMDDLIQRGFVLFYSESTGYSIDKKKCEELFSFDGSRFWELFSSYPIKVPDGRGGARILRTKSTDSEETKKCHQKYNKAIKSKRQHEKMMKCLDLELESKKRTNSMQFMQQFTTWLNQRTWQKYEELLKDEPKEKQKDYGQDLI